MRRFFVAFSAISPLLALVSCQISNTFYDDFSSCVNGQPDPSKWQMISRQWGCSNCNGGVSPANVACAFDPEAGSTVLQLTTHGDLYTGNGPAGVFRNLSQRGGNDEFSGWAYPGYQPACSPFCDVRRVGGSVMSLPSFGGPGGNMTMQIVMKPCNQFGTASAIWMYNYTEETCDETNPSHQCSQEYSDWCCGGQQCMTWNDKCQGDWIRNQEIDIELPVAMGTSVDPGDITFDYVRFTTITALSSNPPSAQCSSSPPCQAFTPRNLGDNQADGKYHLYTMNWVPPTDTFEGYLSFAVDGYLQAEFNGDHLIPTYGQLWLGAWFPNAWAGSPNFDTCTMNIQSVKIINNV